MATLLISEPGRRAPAPTFEEPDAMLHACHQRVQRMCHLLRTLCHHMAQHGADGQAQQAAQDILRYFDLAAPHHHEDEERHIFPRMHASGDAAQIACARTLQQQHGQMAALWPPLRGLLQKVLQGEAAPLLGSPLPESFITLYTQHIALEEHTAYPAVFHALAPAERQSMGAEMARRRLAPD